MPESRTYYQVTLGPVVHRANLYSLREARDVVSQIKQGHWRIERFSTSGHWEKVEEGVKA